MARFARGVFPRKLEAPSSWIALSKVTAVGDVSLRFIFNREARPQLPGVLMQAPLGRLPNCRPLGTFRRTARLSPDKSPHRTFDLIDPAVPINAFLLQLDSFQLSPLSG
jgi:hypothetical protein